ncbi:hypothetical protein Anas_01718 [Armadillidium nasatum]|uniref:Uncharacterized protein n=1 Tax=Armadillidium nasatum TaxID=96803 RepID=A0A5N5T1F4_9CRUS|nr:hypothetical protein Anas_01718 [Armadillidium nasatum]
MANRERDCEMFSDLVNSIRSRLTKFCSDLRKLLSTPTLVKCYSINLASFLRQSNVYVYYGYNVLVNENVYQLDMDPKYHASYMEMNSSFQSSNLINPPKTHHLTNPYLSSTGSFYVASESLIVDSHKMIHENDIEYLYYKSLDIPRCDLILKEIRDHGVTKHSLNVVFDLLFKTTEDMTLSNSEELLPTTGVVSELRKNRISTETIVSGTTSNSTLSPYGVLRFQSFLDSPMHDDSYAQIPLSVVKEESGAIQEVTSERDEELVSESFVAREKESQMRDNSETISGCQSAEKTEPKRKNEEIFHNTVHASWKFIERC